MVWWRLMVSGSVGVRLRASTRLLPSQGTSARTGMQEEMARCAFGVVERLQMLSKGTGRWEDPGGSPGGGDERYG